MPDTNWKRIDHAPVLLCAILAFALIAGLSPAFAQAPPPVPALPDAERRTSYSISGSTCACAVGFQLYGDGTDYANWLEVFVNGARITQSGNWTITSPTGSDLSRLPRPITDAVLTFTAAQTGTVQIVGARRPRRTSQFSESRGVAARDLNQVLTDIIAQNRENWDKTNDVTGRAVLARPGETLALLPALASRANMGACFDSNGNLTSCVAAASSTFAAGTGVTFTGTNPTTISAAATYSAGQGIVFTSTFPTVISATPSSITYTSALTGSVSRTLYSKLGDVIEAADFGAVCDGVTDTRATLQTAIDSTPEGGTLHISKQNTTGPCIVSKSASAYALSISKPIHLVCDRSVSIQPDSSLGSAGSTNDVIKIFGHADGATFKTTIEGCFIGNYSAATRYGRHGVLIDTTTAGKYFTGSIRDVFIQAGTSGTGYGVFLANDPTQNPNGGVFLTEIGSPTSVLQGGVRLDGVGDSIKIRGVVPYNSAASADNNGIYVNLVHGAGDTQINVNLSQSSGLKVDCAYNIDIRGEYELQAASTGNALVDINAGGCTVNGVHVHAQMQAAAGIGTPLLLRFTSNVAAINVSDSLFATPTSYTGVTNASPSLQLGPNYWATGTPHISGTAPANTYGGG